MIAAVATNCVCVIVYASGCNIMLIYYVCNCCSLLLLCRYAVTTKVGSINEKYQIQEYITSVYSKISSAIVPAERVVVPPLEHVGEIINQSLQSAGKAIEHNYNATNRYVCMYVCTIKQPYIVLQRVLLVCVDRCVCHLQSQHCSAYVAHE
jgi:hypothetical protein